MHWHKIDTYKVQGTFLDKRQLHCLPQVLTIDRESTPSINDPHYGVIDVSSFRLIYSYKLLITPYM